MKYVAGFLFNDSKDQVILVKKLKPEWQKNRFNGVGGKVEPSDRYPVEAMVREFHEETGVLTPEDGWVSFCNYTWKDGTVYFYYFHDTDNEYTDNIQTTTEEEIHQVELDKLYDSFANIYPHIYNLNWLLPLAIDPSLDFKKNGPILINE